MKTVIFCECKRRTSPIGSMSGRYDTFLDAHFDRVFEYNVIPSIRTYKKEDAVHVYALDAEASKRLEEYHVKHELVSSPDPDFQKKVKRDVITFCRSIVPLNKTLMSTLYFLTLNFWELDEAVIMEALLPIMGTVRLLSSVIERENPERIVVFDAFSEKGIMVKEIAKKREISCDNHTTFFSESAHHLQRILYRLKKKEKHEFHDEMALPIKEITPFFSSSKRRIIFIVATEKWNTVIPSIMSSLDMDYVIIGRQKKLCKMYGEKSRDIGSYCAREVEKKISHAKTYAPHYYELRDDQTFRSSFTVHGIEAWKSTAHILRKLFTSTPELVLSYYYLFEKVILTEHPDLIVLFGDRTKFGKTIIQVANQYHVSTLIIQPSWMFDRMIDGPTHATKMAVYGKQTVEYLVSKGGRKETYEITGNPLVDGWIKKKRDSRTVRKEFNVPPGKKIILIEDHDEERVRDMFTAFHRYQDYHTLNTTNDEQKNIALISASSLVITQRYIGESLILKKNVFTFEQENEWLKNAGVIFLSSPKDIHKAMKKIKTLKRTINEISYGNDGRSGKRIAKLIEKMIT